MNKKQIVYISLAVCLSLLILGNYSYASGNTSVTNYLFNNTASSSSSSYRIKNNTSAAYVHPTSGLTIYYTLYGAYNSSGSGAAKCSEKVSVPIGATHYLTNYVIENGYSYAKLRFDRMIGSPVNIDTKGTWSPDSN